MWPPWAFETMEAACPAASEEERAALYRIYKDQVILLPHSIIITALILLFVFSLSHSWDLRAARVKKELLAALMEMNEREQVTETARLASKEGLKMCDGKKEEGTQLLGQFQLKVERGLLERISRVPWNQQHLVLRRLCVERGVEWTDSHA